MTRMINVRGKKDNSNDPTFRYKMEQFIIIEQKGKTVINNFDTVAKWLEREPKMLSDYFKKKFGTSMIQKDGTLVTTKKISLDEFETKLFDFIEEFVLCPKCKLPETKIKNNIVLSCKACSWTK